MVISTRAVAIASGSSRYFTGNPCKHGHVAERYVNGGCVPCKEMQAAQWHADNPEKRKLIDAQWASRNPEKIRAKTKRNHERNKEKAATRAREKPEPRRAACRKWRAAHPCAQDAATKRWNAANPEKVLVIVLRNKAKQKELGYPNSRKWVAKNPEKICEFARRRRVRKLKAPGSHTVAESRELKKKTGGRCAICGQRKKLTEDHIIALTKGGSDFINNIQFLCQPCNSAKHNKDPIDFNRSLGRLL